MIERSQWKYIYMTHGHELRWGMLEGVGVQGGGGERGEKMVQL